MTPLQLSQIMPRLGAPRLAVMFPPLSAAMDEFEISARPIRQAAFLAQLALESGELRWMEEAADGSAYEGRLDPELRNTEPGDGKRFKGRGPIQLTGRKNYTAAGIALGIDLLTDPTIAADPKVGFRTAGWFWRSHGLNELADAVLVAPTPAIAFDVITRRINGGLNGKAQRDVYFAKARAVLGC